VCVCAFEKFLMRAIWKLTCEALVAIAPELRPGGSILNLAGGASFHSALYFFHLRAADQHLVSPFWFFIGRTPLLLQGGSRYRLREGRRHQSDASATVKVTPAIGRNLQPVK
jgi:hypothetical protein